MLRSLDDARAETEAALARQREFVADASHELRTPLTTVLANLELLEEELDGRAARDGRLRPALDAAHAPPGGRPAAARARRRRPRGAAPAGRPRRGRHRGGGRARAGGRRPRALGRRAARRDRRRRARRAAPPGAQPDGERPPPHRSGHRRARDGERRNGEVVLAVEDDGPGVAAGAAREGLRALLPRRRRPQRLVAASACRSSAPWPSPTAAACGSRSRSTAAAPASSCACRASEPSSRSIRGRRSGVPCRTPARASSS